MKNLYIISLIMILLSGCSERTMLKNAEKYLKNHIGDNKSYSRIEWEITDTLLVKDIKSKLILDSIKNEKRILQNLENDLPGKFEHMESVRLRNPVLQELLPKRSIQGAQLKIERGHIIGVYTFEEELEMAIKDSINFIQSISKVKSRIADLEQELRSIKETSEISSIELYIRYRAKLNSQYPLTFISKLIYYYESTKFKIISTNYDGI